MTQRHWVQNETSMFVTTNVVHRKPLFADNAKARVAVESLYEAQMRFPFFLYAFVVMPDHCHFLLSPPENGSISRIMYHYKRIVSFNLGEGSIWQPRFDCRLVKKNFGRAIQYIHENPVKAGLTAQPENYAWSSASKRWDVIELDFMGGFA